MTAHAALRRFPLAVPVLVAAVLAAGCGGSKSSGTTSTDEWADNLCSAIGSWATSVSAAGRSIAGGKLSEDTLKSASADVKDATNELTGDLKGLGKPDTEAGQQAKESVDRLSEEIDKGVDTIDGAVDDISGTNGVAKALSTVSSTLVTMGTQLQTTLRDLRSSGANGELQQALESSSSCTSLQKQTG